MRQETKLEQAALALADHLSTGNRRASIELAWLIRADEGKALEWFVGALTDELHKWPVTTSNLEVSDVAMILRAAARHLMDSC